MDTCYLKVTGSIPVRGISFCSSLYSHTRRTIFTLSMFTRTSKIVISLYEAAKVSCMSWIYNHATEQVHGRLKVRVPFHLDIDGLARASVWSPFRTLVDVITDGVVNIEFPKTEW
jgi:hypothetical protein